MDGSTPRDDAGDTLGCQGNVPQENPSMDGEVVNPLHQDGKSASLLSLSMTGSGLVAQAQNVVVQGG